MRHNNTYTFVFITIVTIICAGLLSSAAYFLKDKQRINEEVDMKKNILKAVGLVGKEKLSQNDVLDIYQKSIESFVVGHDGEMKDGKDDSEVEKIDPEKEELKPENDRVYLVFTKTENNKISAYCIPIIGKGLWSTMYGYLALEPTLEKIIGMTFYKQAETPGLGSEVESASFQSKFIGKKIWDNVGNLVAITILKGEPDSDSPNFNHEVAGISGATKTSEGVMNLLLKDLLKYENYFRRIRMEKIQTTVLGEEEITDVQ
ncbi:MAG: NADH:ubiquinone reductase (Na(+)-transporting) subunit C [Candidatus Cloacimonetes bacterium]|nr:NADH:ubiquinone reductase (Na(+)-transporting) subunit C [Candidatus Cloacimonadota bacterium]